MWGGCGGYAPLAGAKDFSPLHGVRGPEGRVPASCRAWGPLSRGCAPAALRWSDRASGQGLRFLGAGRPRNDREDGVRGPGGRAPAALRPIDHAPGQGPRFLGAGRPRNDTGDGVRGPGGRAPAALRPIDHATGQGPRFLGAGRPRNDRGDGVRGPGGRPPPLRGEGRCHGGVDRPGSAFLTSLSTSGGAGGTDPRRGSVFFCERGRRAPV